MRVIRSECGLNGDVNKFVHAALEITLPEIAIDSQKLRIHKHLILVPVSRLALINLLIYIDNYLTVIIRILI